MRTWYGTPELRESTEGRTDKEEGSSDLGSDIVEEVVAAHWMA